MRRRKILTVLIICSAPAILYSSEHEWPPYRQLLRVNFAEHLEYLELAADRILESEYLGVSAGGRRERDVVHDWATAFVEVGEYRQRERFYGEDALEWNRLLESARVFSVLQVGDAVRLDPPFFYVPDGTMDVAYMRSREASQNWHECRNHYRRLDCGACKVPLGGEWWIRVVWLAFPIDPELEEAALEGQLDWEEYEVQARELTDVCFENSERIMAEDSARADGPESAPSDEGHQAADPEHLR